MNQQPLRVSSTTCLSSGGAAHTTIGIGLLRACYVCWLLPELVHTHTHTRIGVGAGIAIYRSGTHIKSLKYRLNKRCTNNQVEQLAILKALVYTVNIHTEDKTATIYTDSQMTQDSLKK
jgi:hypothetical protein